MKRALLFALALVAFLPVPEARAGVCGLPDAQPVWVDFAEGSVRFRNEVFGKPGVVAATSGATIPATLRSRGASTVFWEMRLKRYVGTTTAPADPATIDGGAQAVFEKAVASSGCSTPWIALNEMNGARTTTPWTVTNARYRENLLAFLRALAARGARPFLLIPGRPYTGGEARAWWLQAAEVADLVPELYFNAARMMLKGVVLGSRELRTALRDGITPYTSIGVPATRLGIILGFQTEPGAGGRQGLQPTSAWYRYVKLYTLAARQVAAEFRLPTLWTWGWGTFGPRGEDPDKAGAACVYLWARSGGDPSLCDAAAVVPADFEDSLTEGQITLASGVQCTLEGRNLYAAPIERLTAVTGDRDVAYTILFARLVEDGTISRERVLEAERALIAGRFDGERREYLAAIAAAGATLDVARGAIGDEIRRAEVERRLSVPQPAESQIAEFYARYPQTLARLLRADPAPHWLGGRRTGIALAPAAPAILFQLETGLEATVASGVATYQVTPLDAPLPLGAVPYAEARPAIRAALVAFARGQAYDDGSRLRQQRAHSRAVCAGDDFPAVQVVSLTDYLPFLALNA